MDPGDTPVGALLEQQIRQQPESSMFGDAYVDHGLVFAYEDGMPYGPKHITMTFQSLVASSGLRRVRLHDLRHGRASMPLATGTDIALVSKMLGHSTMAITADTYSHLLEGVERAAAERADASVPGGAVTNQWPTTLHVAL